MYQQENPGRSVRYLMTTVSVDPAGIIPIRRFGFEFARLVLDLSVSTSVDQEELPGINKLLHLRDFAGITNQRAQSATTPSQIKFSPLIRKKY